MIAVNEQIESYLMRFQEVRSKLAGNGQLWLNSIREESINRFAELGFPTTRVEAWKYTNLAPLAGTRFRPARQVPARAVAKGFESLPLNVMEGSRLVFINGHFSPELSQTETLPEGVRAGNLAAVLNDGSSLLENHLARHAGYQDQPFVALNTAFMEDGAYVEIPKGLILEKPILIFHISAGTGGPAVAHPRNLILAERESQATLVEAHAGLGEGVYFSNAVTEIVAGENAHLEYVKFQQESARAFHIATIQAEQDRSSCVHTFSIALGSALSREDLRVVLAGEGAEALLSGLYVSSGEQHVDNSTVIDHAKPHCNSRELYKGVMDGRSSGVFNGRIIVRKDAQKTDAKQSNKNLLLSEDAVINTKPQLEIYADDVKCTHGATVGQIDAEAVFYLRSRGIGVEEARSMLTVAFASEIIDRMKYAPLRNCLRQAAADSLRRKGARP